jgi:hypothetical protein
LKKYFVGIYKYLLRIAKSINSNLMFLVQESWQKSCGFQYQSLAIAALLQKELSAVKLRETSDTIAEDPACQS